MSKKQTIILLSLSCLLNLAIILVIAYALYQIIKGKLDKMDMRILEGNIDAIQTSAYRSYWQPNQQHTDDIIDSQS